MEINSPIQTRFILSPDSRFAQKILHSCRYRYDPPSMAACAQSCHEGLFPTHTIPSKQRGKARMWNNYQSICRSSAPGNRDPRGRGPLRSCHLRLLCTSSLVYLGREVLVCVSEWCERCLLITESPKTPGHYRYLIWVLIYIPYTGFAMFSLRFLVFLCILRFRVFKVRVLNAFE